MAYFSHLLFLRNDNFSFAYISNKQNEESCRAAEIFAPLLNLQVGNCVNSLLAALHNKNGVHAVRHFCPCPEEAMTIARVCAEMMRRPQAYLEHTESPHQLVYPPLRQCQGSVNQSAPPTRKSAPKTTHQRPLRREGKVGANPPPPPPTFLWRAIKHKGDSPVPTKTKLLLTEKGRQTHVNGFK